MTTNEPLLTFEGPTKVKNAEVPFSDRTYFLRFDRVEKALNPHLDGVQDTNFVVVHPDLHPKIEHPTNRIIFEQLLDDSEARIFNQEPERMFPEIIAKRLVTISQAAKEGDIDVNLDQYGSLLFVYYAASLTGATIHDACRYSREQATRIGAKANNVHAFVDAFELLQPNQQRTLLQHAGGIVLASQMQIMATQLIEASGRFMNKSIVAVLPDFSNYAITFAGTSGTLENLQNEGRVITNFIEKTWETVAGNDPLIGLLRTSPVATILGTEPAQVVSRTRRAPVPTATSAPLSDTFTIKLPGSKGKVIVFKKETPDADRPEQVEYDSTLVEGLKKATKYISWMPILGKRYVELVERLDQIEDVFVHPDHISEVTEALGDLEEARQQAYESLITILNAAEYILLGLGLDTKALKDSKVLNKFPALRPILRIISTLGNIKEK